MSPPTTWTKKTVTDQLAPSKPVAPPLVTTEKTVTDELTTTTPVAQDGGFVDEVADE